MRRFGLIVAVLTVAGCRALRDAFTAHPTVAAEVGGQSLSVERLAELAARVKGMPLEEANLSRLADVYVDYLAFAVAVAHGQDLDDSATLARAMWPVLSQQRFNHYFETVSGAIEPTPAQIDSTYAAGDLRAFQHILVTVPPNASPPVVEQKHREIDAVKRQLESSGGVDFAAVARRRSEDGSSKPAGGYLDVGGRGRFLRPFEDAAWQLEPGQMSGVVRTSYGFHIIRRPRLAEIRDTFTVGVSEALLSRFDSTYLSDLAARQQVRIKEDAPQAVRNALQDRAVAARSNQALATYRGGRFAVKDFVRWLYAIDPRYVRVLETAKDSVIDGALRQLIERELALREADSAHVSLPDSEWTAIRLAYDSTLAMLRGQLQLDSAIGHDTAVSAQRRAEIAAAAVGGYFDRVVGGQAEFHAVPALLAQVLREQAGWSVDATGIRSATQRAVALRAAADSLRPPTASPGAGLRPAPGPAPVGPATDSGRPAPAGRR